MAAIFGIRGKRERQYLTDSNSSRSLKEYDQKRIKEIESEDIYNTPGSRIRREGGGCKSLTDTDKTLVSDIESLVDPKGDPMSLLRWTTKFAVIAISMTSPKRLFYSNSKRSTKTVPFFVGENGQIIQKYQAYD